MSDRCCLSLMTRVEDIDKFGELAESSSFIVKGKVAELDMDDVNYGGTSELLDAAAHGAVFFGSHSSGDEYPSESFVTEGNAAVLYRATTIYGDFFVTASARTGIPNPADIKGLKEFLLLWHKVRGRFAKLRNNSRPAKKGAAHATDATTPN